MQGRADCGTSIPTGKYPSVREERNWSDGGGLLYERGITANDPRGFPCGLPVTLASGSSLLPTPYSYVTLAGNNISRQPLCFEHHCGAFQTFRSCCEMLRGSGPTPEPYPSCGAISCESAPTLQSSAERGLRPRHHLRARRPSGATGQSPRPVRFRPAVRDCEVCMSHGARGKSEAGQEPRKAGGGRREGSIRRAKRADTAGACGSGARVANLQNAPATAGA